MSEKNEQCSGSVHVWPDDGDTCKCGKRTHADVEREAKREWTITEKLERMASDRLLRSILTTEDCQELMRNRIRATCEHVQPWRSDDEGKTWVCPQCGADRTTEVDLAAYRGSARFMDNVQDLHELMNSLGARPGPLKERITELVTRTKEMRAQAEKQCERAQHERQALAACPGRTEQRGTLWEDLFMFYLPMCYQVTVEEPNEAVRLEKRVTAAVKMANDAFRIAWEKRA